MRFLHNNWKIQYFDVNGYDNDEIISPDYDDSAWISAIVPGDVHSSLLKAGKIEDPYYSHNDVKCRWIPEKVWWYRCKFNHAGDSSTYDQAELSFDGLDTYATIFLNGKEVGSHRNMFVPITLNITEELLYGENTIAVRFDPVSEDTKKRDFGNMWLEMNKDRVFTRKSATNFGWDWGPVIPTVGIWNNVYLKTYGIAKIENVYAKTIKITDEYAVLYVEANLKGAGSLPDSYVEATLDGDGNAVSITLPIEENTAKGVIKIDKPKLWWTFDIGEPFLYLLDCKLISVGQSIDEQQIKFGIRSISVKMRDENGNTRFTFVLNGVEIFAKGVNWIPADNLMGAVEDWRYIDLISMAREANMNTLRVWGGGIYEKDIFYDTCDELGILVWQDFMFACSSYPDYDALFMKEVESEINAVVRRLRNHASIALWCGNNENQWIHAQKMFKLSDTRHYGERIYSELIPSIVQKLDDSRAYWPGSPYGGNDPNSDEEGDKHNWQVWAGAVFPHKAGEEQLLDLSAGGVSFKRYAEDKGKFISEFGLHASPIKETLKRNVPEDELRLGSFEMDYRNKDITPLRGKMLFESYTGQPRDIDEYIDFSMLCQAEGLKYGVEHYRRRMPDCSGALIWQLNDSWPGTSWSLIDYYHFPKAGYYYAKRFFAPILLSFKEEPGDCVSLWVTNDTLEEYMDTLTVGVENFFGISLFNEKIDVSVEANSSKMIKKYPLSGPDIIMFQRRWNFMYVKASRKDVYKNEYFFVNHEDIFLPKPCLDIKVKEYDDGLIAVIRTDKFARFVKIECSVDGTVMSDNYFNMLPGESREIFIKNKRGTSITPKDIEISCLHN